MHDSAVQRPQGEGGVAAAEHEALRREVERLRVLASYDRGLLDAVLEHSPHGIIVCDRAGKLILQNPASERIWAGSASADDIAGWGQYRAFHQDGRPFAPEEWGMARCLLRGEVMEPTEMRIQRFDGSFGIIIGSAAPIFGRNGELEGAVSTFVDVTRARAAEQEAREAHDRLQLLVEGGTLLSSSLDYETTLSQLTRLVVPVLADWCAVDVLGEDGAIHRLAAHHTDPAKVALAKELHERYPPPPDAPRGVAHVLRSGEVDWLPDIPDELLVASTVDEEHLRLARSLGLRSFVALPLKARGRVLGALTLVHAESGRRYSEEDVAFAQDLARRASLSIDNARLYRDAQRALHALEVEQLTREKLIVALARKNAELDQFAYVASHDLKAPLRGIANLSSWIEEDLADRITPEGKEQMRLLRGRVHRMEALIDGILSYSRAGRVQTKPEEVDVARLLEDVMELLEAPRGAIEVGPGMPVLVTERVPLAQVFQNLIDNAFKHAGEETPEVRVDVRDEEAFWEFSVSDNGPGIAPEFRERIWGIFQTLERRDDVEGTGIGLSVVRKIVEDKGGHAWVESNEGGGATFRFTWPKPETGA